MTQKVFDTDNAEDMTLLWSILPDEVTKIQLEKRETNTSYAEFNGGYGHSICGNLININWHDKTVINRPIPEATEQDIGKICAFWDSTDELINYGVLQSFYSEKYYLSRNEYPYLECYHHCRRLTKQEIEELC